MVLKFMVYNVVRSRLTVWSRSGLTFCCASFLSPPIPRTAETQTLAVILLGQLNQLPMDYLRRIIGEFEIHSVEGIKECFENGINPNQLVNDRPLIYELINMYLRGPLF
ncbi:MAG: hypothetical protein HYZ42_17570, partial [Bacteroidetes bacterium]|nr:hypothetical protein [Bacteroidota bacterium]